MTYPWYRITYGNGVTQYRKLVPQIVYNNYKTILTGASKKQEEKIRKEMKADIGDSSSYFTTGSLIWSAKDVGYYDITFGTSEYRIYVIVEEDERV